jgi:cell shape-determining protein MreC
MGGNFFHLVETVVALIVMVAVIALLVSPKATTSQVIQASGSALGNNLAVAESPVTGATYQVNLSYPSESPWDSSPFHG